MSFEELTLANCFRRCSSVKNVFCFKSNRKLPLFLGKNGDLPNGLLIFFGKRDIPKNIMEIVKDFVEKLTTIMANPVNRRRLCEIGAGTHCGRALCTHSFAEQRGSLSLDETWSVAHQHFTVTTTLCPDRRNLSAHLDLCVSSVTQWISRIRLRIVTEIFKYFPFLRDYTVSRFRLGSFL